MYFQNKNNQTCHKNDEQHSTSILYFIIIASIPSVLSYFKRNR